MKHTRNLEIDSGRHATYYTLKVSPFDWFQGAQAGTDVTSASAIGLLASMEPLNDRVLNEIRKYETECLLSYVVTDGFVPLHRWGQSEQSHPLLSDGANRLLDIPTSSAECERHLVHLMHATAS